MRIIQMVKDTATNTYVQAGVALTMSGSALAVDPPTGNIAAITQAIDAGKGMVQLTTSGVIGIAALGFGLGMVVAWLRK